MSQEESDAEKIGEDDNTAKKENIFGPFYYGTKPEHIMPYNLQYYKDHKNEIKGEVVAGITVAFAQLSDSIAFAFIAGLGPLFGLHAAWIIGFCTSMFGSRPGMINGATGVRAIVIAPYVADLGVGYVFWIILLISIFQALFGITKLCQLINLVPRTVMIGFVNGLAIVLALGQLIQFQYPKVPKKKSDLLGNFTAVAANFTAAVDLVAADLGGQWLPTSTILYMWILISVTVIVILILPRCKYTKILPASICGIIASTLVEHLIFRMAIGIKTPIIGEVANVAGGFPKLFWVDPQWVGEIPPPNWDTFLVCVVPAFIAAAAGAIECVLTMEVVNDMTNSGNESPNQQLYALSLGNFISGLFGTMGGGATIGLSAICCNNGANGNFRISGVIASLCVFSFVMVFSFLIKVIPTSSLIGLMVIMCYDIFDWESLKMIVASSLPLRIRQKHNILESKINRSDINVIVMVTLVIPLVKNGIIFAIAAGILYTGVVYAWQSGSNIAVDEYYVAENKKKIYAVKGPLFFGSAKRFVKLFNIKDDPDDIEIDFRSDAAKIYDFTGFNALNVVSQKYKNAGKTVKVKRLDNKSRKRLSKAKLLITDFEYGEDGGDGDLDPLRLSVVANNTISPPRPKIDPDRAA